MAPLAARIEPDVAIITLVAAAHTEALRGGLEGVAREKRSLPPAAVRADGLALFPSSAAEYAPFRVMAGRVQVVDLPVTAPGMQAPARAGRLPFIITHRGEGTSVTLRVGEEVPETFHFRRVSSEPAWRRMRCSPWRRPSSWG
jgi:UDP-N-acetylmuramoyl-tripeptide--D-alanyl-D-alanine ligase